MTLWKLFLMKRGMLVLAILGGVTVIGTPHAVAQELQLLPPSPEIPDPIEPTPDPNAAKKIQRVLEGDETETASGVLGDVLEMIRRQGSVLDGSVLDDSVMEPPVLDAPDLGTQDKFVPRLVPRRGDRSGTEVTGNASPTKPATRNRPDAFKTAELLLRTARKLESHRSGSPVQRTSSTPRPQIMPLETLVEQMRMHAAGLLAAEFPQATPTR